MSLAGTRRFAAWTGCRSSGPSSLRKKVTFSRDTRDRRTRHAELETAAGTPGGRFFLIGRRPVILVLRLLLLASFLPPPGRIGRRRWESRLEKLERHVFDWPSRAIACTQTRPRTLRFFLPYFFSLFSDFFFKFLFGLMLFFRSLSVPSSPRKIDARLRKIGTWYQVVRVQLRTFPWLKSLWV